MVKRKFLVTTLRECHACHLRFRWLARGFSVHEKDYSHYVAVLKAAGVRRGDRILDFRRSGGHHALASLEENDLFAAFVPNGDPARETLASAAGYHRPMGPSAPLMITAAHLKYLCGRYGFVGQAHTSPYDLGRILAAASGDLSGDELCVSARRRPRIARTAAQRG